MTEISTSRYQGKDVQLQTTSQEMLAKFAIDYSSYFKFDMYSSISKLQEFLEEAAAKLDEFSSLFEMNESESKDWIEQSLPSIIANSVRTTSDFRKRIDTFQGLVEELKAVLDRLEAQVTQAEQSFGTSSSLRSMFNYFRKTEPHEVPAKIPFEPVSIDVDKFFTTN